MRHDATVPRAAHVTGQTTAQRHCTCLRCEVCIPDGVTFAKLTEKASSRSSGGVGAAARRNSLSMNPSEAAASPLVGKRLMHDRYSCAWNVDPRRSRICMVWSRRLLAHRSQLAGSWGPSQQVHTCSCAAWPAFRCRMATPTGHGGFKATDRVLPSCDKAFLVQTEAPGLRFSMMKKALDSLLQCCKDISTPAELLETASFGLICCRTRAAVSWLWCVSTGVADGARSGYEITVMHRQCNRLSEMNSICI